jgi:hypothetical protein
MRGVSVHVTAAVGAEHLDGHLGGHRPLRDRLRIDDLVLHDRLALGVENLLAFIVDLLHLNGELLRQLRGLVWLEF